MLTYIEFCIARLKGHHQKQTETYQICPARSEATCAHRFADEALTAAQEVLEVASASSRCQ